MALRQSTVETWLMHGELVDSNSLDFGRGYNLDDDWLYHGYDDLSQCLAQRSSYEIRGVADGAG